MRPKHGGPRRARVRGNGESFMKEVRRAAIYVRCSTAEQETDMQETELLEYCEKADIVNEDDSVGNFVACNIVK
jgi:hypothetical protein